MLLNPGSHTVMVSSVSGSSITIVHASINEKGTATGGKSGDQTGKEICTRSYYGNWTYVLRHSSSSAPAPTPAPTTGIYYARYTGTSDSLVDALNALKIDSSYANRTRIATANRISNYSGTAAQNTQLLDYLKSGILVKAGVSASFFPRYTGTSGSLVDGLVAVGSNSSYSYRAQIAAKNGVSGYSGTAAQNSRLLDLLKLGHLVKP